MKDSLGRFTLVLAVIMMLAGCKKEDGNPTTPPPGGSGTYVGTIAGANESGKLTLNVAASKVTVGTGGTSGITGTLIIVGGGTITLTGTYNNGSISVTGGGYTFTGTIVNGVLSGTYTGPNGIGGFSTQTSTSGTVAVYVGTFTSQTGGSSGRFNLVVSGSALSGVAVSTTNDLTNLIGTASGSSLTIRDAANPTSGLATGTVSGTTASGTYNAGSNQGIWSGTLIP